MKSQQRTKKGRTKTSSVKKKTTRSRPKTQSRRIKKKTAAKSTSPSSDMSGPAFHLEVKRGAEKTARSADTGFHLYVGKNPETSHEDKSESGTKSETETASKQKKQ